MVIVKVVVVGMKSAFIVLYAHHTEHTRRRGGSPKASAACVADCRQRCTLRAIVVRRDPRNRSAYSRLVRAFNQRAALSLRCLRLHADTNVLPSYRIQCPSFRFLFPSGRYPYEIVVRGRVGRIPRQRTRLASQNEDLE